MTTARANKVTQIVIALLATAILSVAVILANSSHGEPSAPSTTASGTGETIRVTVSVAGMAFVPNRIEVPAGARLVITLRNTASEVHDLTLATGPSTGRVAAHDTVELDAGVITGDVDAWCAIAGHRAMGMTLDIVAVGASHEHTPEAPGTPAVASPTFAQLMTQAAAVPASDAALPPLTDETVHNVTFTVTESTEQVAEGFTRTVWSYNGTAPGPTLHGRVGDTFRVTLVNNGTMGHSIDFHAGEVSPDEPMRTIEPGESLVYEFTANRPGIWMYHCSTMPMSQHIASGMFGAVVIEPEGLAPVDETYVVVQSELYLSADSGPADTAKLAALAPDVVAFNGRAFQYAAHPLTAHSGDRVRIWVLDAGPNMPLSFHVVGAQFDTVWTEGAAVATTGAQVLPLQPAQGGFVEFTAGEPGHYSFVNHTMSLAEKGAQGVLTVSK